VEFYIKVGKPFASSNPNHCFAWLFNYLSLSRISSLAWCLILILFICFFVVKMILDLCVKYHWEINNSKYLLSLDNWYFIMWYIYIDQWYVHFASLFYIIIYYYSLIYFIFRGDTFVVSSAFTCLMIIGELAAGVRILLEKGPSRHHISEDQQF
jgi:hypothetical protein